ncbi:MAG: hypothetical protein GXX83_10380 [Gaiellales bacterium]|nr:hypothetical protein [Gaiellales bacterium]
MSAARQACFAAQGTIDIIMTTTQSLFTHVVNNMAKTPYVDGGPGR